jgi:phage tail-like protein
MTLENSKLVSNYLQYLPAIFQEDLLMGKFLLAFEKILSGDLDSSSTNSKEKIIEINSTNIPGLEEIINQIYTYFDSDETPEQFLPWLASWIALSLQDDWKVETKREFIKKIVKLYRIRGTKKGLIEVLKIYLKNLDFGEEEKINIKIFDQFKNFPNYFQVQLTLNDRDLEKYWRVFRIAKAIIDQEKPAHTFYSLKILIPTMKLTRPVQGIYPFKTDFNTQRFTLKQNLTLKQDLILEGIVTINQSQSVTENIINQIIVRFQDNNSSYHLLTPETVIQGKKITIKRQLSYQQLIDIFDQLKLTVKNLNNVEISGQVSVTINNGVTRISTVFEQDFKLAAISPNDILKICYKNQDGKIITTDEQGTVFTVLGTQ